MVDRRSSFGHIRAKIVRKLLVKIRNQVDLLQEPPVRTDLARKTGGSGVSTIERGVVIIDKVAEKPSLPVNQRTQPQRHARGADHIRRDRFLDFQPYASAHDGNRMSDQQRHVLVTEMAEWIHRPER